MRRRRMPVAAAAVAVALGLAGCAGPPPNPATPTPAASFDASPLPQGSPREVTGGLVAPWSVVTVDGTALVSERDSARILELVGRRTREVAKIGGIRSGGEGGLLGLAVDDRRRLYVYSTGEDGNRIERYGIDGTRGSYRLSGRTTILDGLPRNTIHNGGRLAIGPDGMLYASVGDAGTGAAAQDPRSLAGKILRMTLDGGVPESNPFPGSLVYSLGHRNVQGLGWAADGTMYAVEFGQNAWDELNRIVPGGNYGWPEVEGRGTDARYRNPIQQWPPSQASPSGMAVIGGTIYVANLRGERLRAIAVDDPGTAREYYVGDYGRLRTVLRGPDGELWFVTNNRDGRGDPRPGDDRILRVPLGVGT
ncbi:MAG: PQQ-dependent sugar dehydrogenase [Micrococcales bacterium]|nr:PQQ-dependent sugar dehydrogenase [Micrococcales bacterium]